MTEEEAETENHEGEEEEQEQEGNMKVEKNKEMEEALFAEIFQIEKENSQLIKDLNAQADGILQGFLNSFFFFLSTPPNQFSNQLLLQ